MTDKTFYIFSFSFTVGGIVESEETVEQARDKLSQELALMYGPETVTIHEFRPATDEEVAEYKGAVTKAVTESADETTVN